MKIKFYTKRIIALAISMIVILGLMPTTVFADGTYDAKIHAGTIANLKAGKLKGNITITNDISQTYDGTAVEAPEYNVNSNGEVTVEYKSFDADDSAYSTEKPVKAGRYTVRVSAGETSTVTAAMTTADFTIDKKAVTVTATAPDKVYDGDTTIDTSAIVITFHGLVDADIVGCIVKDAWYNGSGVGTDKCVPIVFHVIGDAAANYSFPTGGEWMAPDYYVEAVADITPADQTAPSVNKDDETNSDKEDSKITDDDTEDPNAHTPSSPQTGDYSKLWLLVALLFISGAGILKITMNDRNKR